MDFSLNEVQAMLADSIEKFIGNDYDFDSRQAYSASELGFSADVWQTFAELGWTAVPFSEADGGFDGGAVDIMVVMERLGRGLVVEPYLANVVLAGGVMKRLATAEQKDKWLTPMMAGELQTTLAFVEPQSRYDVNNCATTATMNGDGYTLNGAKGYVLNAASANIIFIPARTSGEQTDESGITLFAVDRNAAGLSVQEYQTVDGLRAAEVTLDNVQAAAADILGDVDAGFAALQASLHEATLAVCAEAVGIMTLLTEKTVEYTKSRVQFGVPISSFQALQHRMVEMYTACEQSRSLMMWAAMTMDDADQSTAHAIHSLKYQIGIAGKRVGEEAVQIHGGMGVTWELDVAHHFKRLTAITVMFGNADWHLDRLAV